MARQDDICWSCGGWWTDPEGSPLTKSELPESASREPAGPPELLVSAAPGVDAGNLVPA